MLRCAQHDRTESVIPNASEESTAWMLRCAQHDRTESVIPNASEESTAWMLRCAQHDRTESVIPNASEESAHGCFAALSMTNRGSVDAALGMTR